MKIDDPKPFDLAKLVRRAAEIEFRSPTLADYCMVCSYVLHGVLHRSGFESAMVGGLYSHTPVFKGKLRFGDPKSITFARNYDAYKDDHCWVEYDNQIWDLTLTQFVCGAEPVSILKLDDQRFIRERIYATKLDATELNYKPYLSEYGHERVQRLLARMAKLNGQEQRVQIAKAG